MIVTDGVGGLIQVFNLRSHQTCVGKSNFHFPATIFGRNKFLVKRMLSRLDHAFVSIPRNAKAGPKCRVPDSFALVERLPDAVSWQVIYAYNGI